LEAQTKLQLKQMEIQAKGEADAASHTVQISEADKDRLVKLEVAEISTKAQDVNQRLQLFNDLLQQLHQQAHELGMAMQTHQHNMELGQQAAAIQSAQQASEQQPGAGNGAAPQPGGSPVSQ